MPITYKDSGVDVERGYKAVELMKKHTKTTFDGNVLGDLGSFGAFYSLDAAKKMKRPVLVSGTDGVGTKLKYAVLLEKHDTIGIDAVAMCVNDVVCQGAKPLFFLDYIASGRIDPERTAEIVGGMSNGCRQAGCALIGGETAEMPGFYRDGEYDIAGFTVGLVDEPDIINGKNIADGDVLIGLGSSGLHSNGFSLVRKLLGEDKKALEKYVPELSMTLGETLLTPTRIYVNTVLELQRIVNLKGVAHITGGGFVENIPRILPDGLGAEINTNAYELPYIFKLLVEKAKIEKAQAYNTFNMGFGMVLAVPEADAEKTLWEAAGLGEEPCLLGRVKKGSGVTLI